MNDGSEQLVDHLVAARGGVAEAVGMPASDAAQILVVTDWTLTQIAKARAVLESHAVIGPPYSEMTLQDHLNDAESALRFISAAVTNPAAKEWGWVGQSLRRAEALAMSVDMVPMPREPAKRQRMTSKPATRHITIKAPVAVPKIKIKGVVAAGGWIDEDFTLEA